MIAFMIITLLSDEFLQIINGRLQFVNTTQTETLSEANAHQTVFKYYPNASIAWLCSNSLKYKSQIGKHNS